MLSDPRHTDDAVVSATADLRCKPTAELRSRLIHLGGMMYT